MHEFRCKFCHRLLARVEEAGKVEIKCPKCKTLNLYSDNEIVVVEIDEAYLQKKISKGKINFELIKN
ncbi:MAG TPA: Com family DNA-binding transcriptional regulator [Candidatus Omnitrophota bacterium]|nr:Com family DNA-binding transcriptional regulator [Candidatus Omnitrophota bacterium]